MGGRELDQHVLALHPVDPDKQRRTNRAAAVHVADRVAAEHPHPLDQLMPRLAGRTLAKDPVVAAEVLELLAALGLNRKEQQ